MQKKIKEALDKIRPGLQADGGDVEFVSFDDKNGQVKVRMVGACAGCPMSQMTLKMRIEEELKTEVPEVNEVINIYKFYRPLGQGFKSFSF